VSYTHDGGSLIALAASGRDLRGLGVDAVYLPRLRAAGKGRDHLMRLAARFMSPREYGSFCAAGDSEDDRKLSVRVAAHFSLMEAAAKALGTGLRLGGGIGRSGALPPRALNLESLDPVRYDVTAKADSRRRVLGARRLEGRWSHDDEFLISTAVLFA
jgi:hypothetical protein